jgi:hypothetical protein
MTSYIRFLPSEMVLLCINKWAELRQLSKTTLRFQTMYKKPRQEYDQEADSHHSNSYTTYLKFLAALAVI